MIVLTARIPAELARLITEKEAEGYTSHGTVLLECKGSSVQNRGAQTVNNNVYSQFMSEPKK